MDWSSAWCSDWEVREDAQSDSDCETVEDRSPFWRSRADAPRVLFGVAAEVGGSAACAVCLMQLVFARSRCIFVASTPALPGLPAAETNTCLRFDAGRCADLITKTAVNSDGDRAAE